MTKLGLNLSYREYRKLILEASQNCGAYEMKAVEDNSVYISLGLGNVLSFSIQDELERHYANRISKEEMISKIIRTFSKQLSHVVDKYYDDLFCDCKGDDSND